jgi:hypothetical protein
MDLSVPSLPSFNLPGLGALDLGIDWASLSLPEFGLTLLSLPGLDLSLPDIDLGFLGLTWPELTARLPDLGLDWLNLTLPELVFALPRLNIPGFDIDLSGLLPEFGFDWAALKLPSVPGVSWPDVALPNLTLPQLGDVSLGDLLTSLKNLLPSLPGVSLTLPDFGTVNWDTIRLPNLALAFPNLQIDWATLSLPEFLFALPRLNLPGLQLSFDFSQLLPEWPDVKLGDLAFPDVNVDWAQLSVMQFLFKLPQMDLPGLDFGLFGIELPELPSLDGLIGKLPFDLDLQNLGFRIFGDLDLAFGDSFVLSGRFGFEKLPNWLSVVGQDIDLTLSAGGFEVGALDANLGLVIDGDGIAFEGSGALHADLGGMATLGAAQATVFYNSTGKDWTGRTLTIGTVTHTFGRLGADDLRGVALDDASLTIADFVQAEGDLVVRDSVQTLKLADGSDLDAKVLSIGGSALTGFAGLGAGTAARTGLALSHLEIAAALVTDRKDATRRWTSLQAQGSACLLYTSPSPRDV